MAAFCRKSWLRASSACCRVYSYSLFSIHTCSNSGVCNQKFTAHHRYTAHDDQSTFDTMVQNRRKRARRSVLVNIYSKFVVPQLYAYCQTYGSINQAFHCTLENDKVVVLIEFENEDSVHNLLSEAQHVNSNGIVPIHSRYLRYQEREDVEEEVAIKNVHEECLIPSEECFIASLQKAQSISDQMVIHHKHLQLSDLGCQFRFFVCQQIESAFEGLFSDCVTLPFGSSVNGFGKFNCDLDMVMTFDRLQKNVDSPRMFFHAKRSLSNERMQLQRYLEIFGDMMSSFFPGCSNVQRILHARVPIIKFKQEMVQLECDLSMHSLTGVYMSELLYLYGEFDARVRPLVFTVLKWARETLLTHENPGRWVTNFTLILMVIVFLQSRPEPLLPSLGTLQDMARQSDRRITEDVDCTFLRNVNAFPIMQNKEELGDLLMEFFAFYASFNFKTRGLSLINGGEIDKPDYSSLYIMNPLETELNVSKNVTGDEVKRLSTHMQTALWSLETVSSKNGLEWGGLLPVFDPQHAFSYRRKKMVPVSALFEDRAHGEPAVSNNSVQHGSSPHSSARKWAEVVSSNDFVKTLELKKLLERGINMNDRRNRSETKSRRESKRRPRP